MRLDHVSYATSSEELADTVQRLGAALGASFIDGGRHPAFGTRNFVLPLAGGIYLEVVAALDHPAADKLAFGRAVKQRAAEGGGWLTWVVSVDDMAAVEERMGRPCLAGHRRRPDGYDLRWKQLGLVDVLEDPSLPYFIEWDVPEDEHPSHVATARVEITSCELAGDIDKIREYLGGPLTEAPIDGSDIEWVDGEDPGLVAVTFRNAAGDLVRID